MLGRVFIFFAILACMVGTAGGSVHEVAPYERYEADHLQWQVDENIEKSQSAAIKSELKRTDELLGPYFELPHVLVQLNAKAPVTESAFSGAKLEIGFRKVQASKTGKDLEKVKMAIWIHEYAHAYFDWAMERSGLPWKECKEKASALENIEHLSKECLFLFMGSKPYNELFADAVAAIVLKNGRVNADVLIAEGYPAERYLERDFTAPESDKEDLLGFPYGGMRKSRKRVWFHYVRLQKESNFESGLFIRKLFDAIEAEIKLRAQKIEDVPNDEIDRRLVQRIDFAFERRNSDVVPK